MAKHRIIDIGTRERPSEDQYDKLKAYCEADVKMTGELYRDTRRAQVFFLLRCVAYDIGQKIENAALWTLYYACKHPGWVVLALIVFTIGAFLVP